VVDHHPRFSSTLNTGPERDNKLDLMSSSATDKSQTISRLCVPISATFVDNVGNKSRNKTPFEIGIGTFVFFHKSDWCKMVAVDADGKHIECRYMSRTLPFTKANWEQANRGGEYSIIDIARGTRPEAAATLQIENMRGCGTVLAVRGTHASNVAGEAPVVVSVVIPSYNRHEKLLRAIKSVRAQECKGVRIQIIVVNDASPEKAYYARHEGLMMINLPQNSGGRPGLVRNLGLKVATGKFIAFLDDDDVWLPKKIEAQLRAMRRTGSFLLICDFAYW